MRNLLFVLVLAGILKHTSGQTPLSLSNYHVSDGKYLTGATGQADINSTVLTNEFMNKFIYGGSIDLTLKNKISGKLLPSNRLGGDITMGLYYAQRIDSLCHKSPYHLSYFIGLYDRQHFDARFSKDLFNMGFFGNKMFANDTADLGNLNVNSFRYQQLQLGIINDDGMGNRYGVGLSLLKGEQHRSINADEIDFYTSDIGDEIDIYMNATFRQSDTATSGFEAMNGWGTSLDLMYELNYDVFQHKGDGSGKLRLEVNDLGFIHWNQQSFNYAVDTSFNFQGLVINNLFDLHDSVIIETRDSLLESYTRYQKKSGYFHALPVTFRMTVMQKKNKHSYAAGIMYKHLANYNPYLFIRETWHFSKAFALGGRLAYGGYGKFTIGLEVAFTLKGFRLSLGSHTVSGFALPTITSGLSGYGSLSINFGK